MSEFDKADFPFLTKKDEEYRMLRDFAGEFSKQEGGSARYKSGKATISVIRRYLVEHHLLNIAELDAKIPEKGRMNLLFLLKKTIPRKPVHDINDMDAVLKISNNAVGSSRKNTPSEPIKVKFERLKLKNRNLRTCVVVLVENPDYKNKFKGAYTCVIRNPATSKALFDDVNVIDDLLMKKQFKKTGDWRKLISYLKSES